MKDWVYLEGVRKVELVGDRGDLLNDLVWANESVLQLLGWSSSLGCEMNVCRCQKDLVIYLKLHITARFVRILLLVGFGND